MWGGASHSAGAACDMQATCAVLADVRTFMESLLMRRSALTRSHSLFSLANSSYSLATSWGSASLLRATQFASSSATLSRINLKSRCALKLSDGAAGVHASAAGTAAAAEVVVGVGMAAARAVHLLLHGRCEGGGVQLLLLLLRPR